MPTKVLVIDDDPAITELIGLLLGAQGFEAVTTNSSVEGVKLAKEVSPHIILLDLMMPELDGQQVCRAVRRFSNVPILALSAVSDPDMVAQVLDAGADSFLTKPVPTSVLIAHVRKLLRRQTGSLANVLKPPAESAAPRRNTQPLVS